MSFFQNTCKPKGFVGKLMVKSMNMGHKSLHLWGFEHLNVKDNSICLDIGCGGGTNLIRLISSANDVKAYGIDYSLVSVEESKKRCKKFIEQGNCFIQQMDVLDLDFKEKSFDLITAFETIYFWQDLERTFKSIYEILQDGGQFFICNESNGKNPKQEKWCDIIDNMKIYKIEEIKNYLYKAGFKEIKVDDTQKDWVCFLATK